MSDSKRAPSSIVRIKEKYESEWMKLPGVEGVGVTEKDGQECIVIYVSNKKSVQENIPPIVERIPVIFEATGSFTAF